MVDFNSDATVGSTPTKILNILVIQRQSDFLEAYETQIKESQSNRTANIPLVKSRLLTFYLQCSELLKRQVKNCDIRQKITDANNLTAIEDAYNTISEALDKARITRIDTKTPYDSRNIEEENKTKNL